MKDRLTVGCKTCGCGPWSLNEEGERVAEEHTLLTGHEDFLVSDGGSIHLPAPQFHILCDCGFETADMVAWAKHISGVRYGHAFRRVLPTASRKEEVHRP